MDAGQTSVKCISRNLAIENNEIILSSARVGSEIINWIAANVIGKYYLSTSHTCHITSSSLQHLSACA